MRISAKTTAVTSSSSWTTSAAGHTLKCSRTSPRQQPV
jgi:hypothetical protein